jgi:hypothetical protein
LTSAYRGIPTPRQQLQNVLNHPRQQTAAAAAITPTYHH